MIRTSFSAEPAQLVELELAIVAPDTVAVLHDCGPSSVPVQKAGVHARLAAEFLTSS